MKKIKIFLASSISDLQDDRIALGDFIRQLNEIYIDKGIYISLVKCEDYDNAIALSGKQSEYDREIEDSELCLFIFYRKVGEYTMHELDVAYRAFAEKSHPKIVTYLRADPNTQSLSEALGEIISRLDGEYHHYYNVYAHIDTLKLGVIMQLKLMKLDSQDELGIKDGVLSLDGKEILVTENIPIFSKNTELCSLYAERTRLEKTLKQKRERYFELKSAEAEEEFFLAAGELNKLSSRLASLESEALSLVSSVAELTSDGRVLTRRQKLALEFFNAGNYKRAQSVLDDEAREDELALAEKRIETARREVEGYIEENRLWIKAQRAQGVDAEAFDKITEKYQRSAELCHRHGLDKAVILDYANFLFYSNRNDEAIRVAQRLRRMLDETVEAELSLLIEVTNLLGTLWCENKNFKAAEQMYIEAQRLNESKTNDKSRLWDGASNHLLLSNLYASFDDYKNSINHALLSMNAYKKIAKAFGYRVQSDIALCGLNLGRAYAGLGRREEAVRAYIDAINCIKDDVERDFHSYAPTLARLFNNLSITYYEMTDAKNARHYGELAIDIFKRCEGRNPEQMRAGLAVAYGNLAMVLSLMNDMKASEEAFSEAIMRYEILTRESFDAYGGQLAVTYINLGELQRRMLMLDESVASSKRAIDIFEHLLKNNADAYTPNLADAYNNAAAVYLQMDDNAEAEASCLKAIALYETLYRQKGGVYLDKLMTANLNLATARSFLGENDKARKAYGEILDYFDKNPDYKGTAIVCLPGAHYGMCMILWEEGEIDQAEEHINKAVEIYERLSESSPELYLLGLADAYHAKGTLYLDIEKIGTAIKSFTKARELYGQLRESNPVGVGGKLVTMLVGLGSAYLCYDGTVRAIESYLEALDILFDLLSDRQDHFLNMLPEVLEIVKNADSGDINELNFVELISRSINRLDEIYGKDSEISEQTISAIRALL